MRLHRPLITLCAVLAIANVGIATYIAASPRPPSLLSAAVSSDDQIVVPSEQTPLIPTAEADQPEKCTVQTNIIDAEKVTIGPPLPFAATTIGAFRIALPNDTFSCLNNEKPALLNEMTLKFDWDGLSPPSRVAQIRNIAVSAVGTGLLGGYGILPSNAPSREIRIPFKTPLAIPSGGNKTIIVTADTTYVRGGQDEPVQLRVSLMKIGMTFAHILARERTLAEFKYPSLVVRAPHVSAALQPDSPAGLQPVGQRLPVALFQITADADEPLVLNRLLLRLDNGALNRLPAYFPPNFRVRVQKTEGGQVGGELGPLQVGYGGNILFADIAPARIILEPGTQYSLSVFADLYRGRVKNTFRVGLINLAVVGQRTNKIFDSGVLTTPAFGSVISH